jgi:chemotaxis protein histidine kinase CheA
VEVLLDPWVEEDFVTDINPLAQLKVSLPTDRGDFETKYLEFRFKRVYGEENKIIYLLVTVADATERVMLSEKLEAAKENTRSQLSLLLGLTHIERPRLNQFFEETDREIRKINALLKVSTSTNVDMVIKSVDYVELTNSVFRDIHTIKGHARLLSLEFFELGATKLEEKVAELREQARMGTLKGQDFIPLVVGLQEFFHELTELRRLFSRLSGDLDKGVPTPSSPTPSAPVRKQSDANTGAESTDSNRLVRELTEMVNKLAQENNKQIQINSYNFDLEMIPERYRSGLSGVLIHLVTNSAIHGIEGQLERRSSGKPSSGTIKLTSYLGQDEKVWVTVQDDGRGYNIEAIRRKAMELYGVPYDYFANWTEEQITHMVFYDGLSTAESLTRAAGRGVGLSAVAARASEFGGSVHVQNAMNKGSTFYFSMATIPTDFTQYPALKRLKENAIETK